MTNREFAAQDGQFRECCRKVGISPTKRQASKYRRKKGKAFLNTWVLLGFKFKVGQSPSK